LSSDKREAEEIIEGRSPVWPVASMAIVRECRGLPRSDEVEAAKAATAAGFGWKWQHFTKRYKYEQQFIGWIAPVTPEFFKDKIVLEGGCGKGRHTQLAAQWEP